MNRIAHWFEEMKSRARGLLTIEAALSLITVAMIGVFFRVANEDRLLLNLYYIGIAGSAYASDQTTGIRVHGASRLGCRWHNLGQCLSDFCSEQY